VCVCACVCVVHVCIAGIKCYMLWKALPTNVIDFIFVGDPLDVHMYSQVVKILHSVRSCVPADIIADLLDVQTCLQVVLRLHAVKNCLPAFMSSYIYYVCSWPIGCAHVIAGTEKLARRLPNNKSLA
jgi:hypothetical protein